MRTFNRIATSTALALVACLPTDLSGAEHPTSEPARIPAVTLRAPTERDLGHARNSAGLEVRKPYGKHPQLAIPHGDSLSVAVKFLDALRARSTATGGLDLLGGAVPAGIAEIIAAESLTFRPSFSLDEDTLTRKRLSPYRSASRTMWSQSVSRR